jgi:3-phenylpropionate/trans-cinnamate dioxygenase ferredoxin subunit
MIWHKIAESKEELFLSAENKLVEIEVCGKKICVSAHQHQLFSCIAKCPHAGGKMAEGYIDALGNIVCPLHRYKFDLKKGRNTSGEGYFLKTYPIEEREDGIFVAI